MFGIGLLVLWFVCIPVSYLLFRWSEKKMFGEWTKADRLFALVMSLFGPVFVLVNAFIAMIMKLAQSKWANEEANW